MAPLLKMALFSQIDISRLANAILSDLLVNIYVHSAYRKFNLKKFNLKKKSYKTFNCRKTTDMLINESGCMLEHPAASNFSNLIMSGEWEKAEKALNDLKTLIDLSADITVS